MRSTPGRPCKLSEGQCVRLLKLLLEGAMAHGYRTELWTTQRIAEFIEARFGVRYHRDHVGRLMRALEGGVDPLVIAAAASFGLVYIHPFEDGNGRIHRWIIHHVLAASGLTPPELLFPVIHVILRRVAEYRAILESYSRPLLPLIEWEETDDHNVHVLNETADYYRYFDATLHTEFLYACVRETIHVDLPQEVRFLESFDRFASEVQDIVELPQGVVDLLARFLEQGDGALSRRARSREFAAFTDAEVREVEALYSKAFGGEALPDSDESHPG